MSAADPEFNPLDALDSAELNVVEQFDVTRGALLQRFIDHRNRLPEDDSYEAELSEHVETLSANFRLVASYLLLWDEDTHAGVESLAQLWHADESERLLNLAVLRGAEEIHLDTVADFKGKIGAAFAKPGTESDSLNRLEDAYFQLTSRQLDGYISDIEHRKWCRDTMRSAGRTVSRAAIGAIVIGATSLLAQQLTKRATS